ncbi:integrator complex subunit 4-like isoform X4 [Oncorhynchus nerka]|uniref:integrator complex subunit 4-like isoform X4 n=1 Tax=Oncorhynchus nerka TaxID=8023 RepID=UPI0031B841B0
MTLQHDNAVCYREDILPRVVPFLQAHPDMTLQHDNATSHAARSVRDFLQGRNVSILPCPAKSLDLNPIEHIWDLLDRGNVLLMSGPRSSMRFLPEFSSGRKWADDAPKEKVDTSAVNLIASGACGAFVHGLEDEMYEVRIAAVDAFSALAQSSASFAEMCLDDEMFNDEIEAVRLQSIHVLRQISTNTLREDQLDTVLAVLEDSSRDIREALHELLCFTNVSTKECIQLALLELLKNLTKYPTDRNSVWKCLKFLGCRHPTLVLPLVPELLSTHPYFHTPEPDMDGPDYIAVLVLVFNAAQSCPTMTALFSDHTFRHYTYLRDSLSHLVPPLRMLEETYKRVFLYNGLENRQVATIHHVRLQAKALQRVLTARTRRGVEPLINVCEKFLQEVESFQRLFVVELPHLQESFVGKLLGVSPRLSACKPGELVKILQTTLRQSGFLNLQFPKQVQRASATIIEPTGESDNPLRFTSGLVVALDIDATLEHVQDPHNTKYSQTASLM